MANLLSLKKYESEYINALKEAILSKEEYHIWTTRELIFEINKKLKDLKMHGKKPKVGNPDQLGHILRCSHTFYKFKSHHDRTRYIFIRKKKLKVDKIEFISESSLTACFDA